jgi:hypothetical protein
MDYAYNLCECATCTKPIDPPCPTCTEANKCEAGTKPNYALHHAAKDQALCQNRYENEKSVQNQAYYHYAKNTDEVNKQRGARNWQDHKDKKAGEEVPMVSVPAQEAVDE